MRGLTMAAAVLAMGAATAVQAGDRMPANGGPGVRSGGGWNRPGLPAGPRWGGRVQGRWWGGWRAPGGWGAYRRPVRGWVLPSYWIAPSWYVRDWSGYGLPRPPAGYNWSRYYDDAVLIDERGSVQDTIGGVDWDQDDGYDDAAIYEGRAYPAGAGAARAGAPYPVPPRAAGRDTGLGSAAVGAVAGGVAGNVLAGRGNRLGGTLIGAGVGAAAGYAIDRSKDRDRRLPPPPPPYGADFPPPRHHGGSTVIGSSATAVTSSPAPGYYADGYYYPGPTITTVTIQSQPVVTTTTTETWETRRRPAKVWHRKTWRAGPKCICR